MTPPWTVRRLEEIPSLPEGGVTVEGSAGQTLVAAHDERGSGREELYVVLRGAAVVMLDRERVELRRGMTVKITDPSVWRSARATAAGTALLVVGAGGDPFVSTVGPQRRRAA